MLRSQHAKSRFVTMRAYSRHRQSVPPATGGAKEEGETYVNEFIGCPIDFYVLPVQSDKMKVEFQSNRLKNCFEIVFFP